MFWGKELVMFELDEWRWMCYAEVAVVGDDRSLIDVGGESGGWW